MRTRKFNLFEKLFMDSEWHIATRITSCHWPFDYEGSFVELKSSLKGYWFADPLIYGDGEKVFLFCEAFNKKEQKGEIAVFSYDGTKWVNPQVIISNNYHMSYPCVFKHDDGYYMVPESQENNTVDLYKAISFPYNWVKYCTLYEGGRIADTTVWKEKDIIFLYGYVDHRPYQSIIWKLDMTNHRLIKLHEIPYSENVGRPAGPLLRQGKAYLRPSQDCRFVYGGNIIWNRLSIEGDMIREKPDIIMNPDNIKINNKIGVDRIHTFSSYNDIEVIDYCTFKFNLFYRFKVLYRAYKRKIRAKKRYSNVFKNLKCEK